MKITTDNYSDDDSKYGIKMEAWDLMLINKLKYPHATKLIKYEVVFDVPEHKHSTPSGVQGDEQQVVERGREIRGADVLPIPDDTGCTPLGAASNKFKASETTDAREYDQSGLPLPSEYVKVRAPR